MKENYEYILKKIDELEKRINIIESTSQNAKQDKNLVSIKCSEKYYPLAKFLISTKEEIIELSFDEIEKILNFTLSKSASLYREFWANTDRPIASSWQSVGYKTEKVDLFNRKITFLKIENIEFMETFYFNTKKLDYGTIERIILDKFNLGFAHSSDFMELSISAKKNKHYIIATNGSIEFHADVGKNFSSEGYNVKIYDIKITRK